MGTVQARKYTLTGTAHLRRIGRLGFPVQELTGEDGVLARLGRDGSLRMMFGRGRRVQLDDGAEWRIKTITLGRHIVPIIVSDAGTIATSGPLYAKRSYGINGPGYGVSLIPMGKVGLISSGKWVLRQHEEQIALIDQSQNAVHADEPVPIAAVIMAFTLATHGIPGEGDLMPRRD